MDFQLLIDYGKTVPKGPVRQDGTYIYNAGELSEALEDILNRAYLEATTPADRLLLEILSTFTICDGILFKEFTSLLKAA